MAFLTNILDYFHYLGSSYFRQERKDQKQSSRERRVHFDTTEEQIDDITDNRNSLIRASKTTFDIIQTLGTYTGEALKSGYHNISNIDYQSYFAETSYILWQTYRPIQIKVNRLLTNQTIYDDFPMMTRDTRNVGKTIAKIMVPVSNDITEFEEIQVVCNICLERVPDRVLIPCGHTFCAPCLAEIGLCPTCRTNTNGIMKIYL